MDPDEETLRLKRGGTGGGTTGRLRLFALTDTQPRVIPLPERGEVTVGRAEGLDVQLDDAAISRRHLTLHLGEEVRLEDLGSVNGTRVRGRDLTPGETVGLSPGDPVEIGRTLLVLQRTAPAVVRRVRVHGHDDFIARVEDECGRAERGRRHFSIVRLQSLSPRPEGLEERLASQVQPGDVLGEYGPGDYEVLLVDCEPSLASSRAGALAATASAAGGSLPMGMASYPADGTTPAALLERANARLRGTGPQPPAQAPAMEREGAMDALRRIIDRIAAGTISVLVTGETGVGKGVLAAELHRKSPRADRPFLALNCAELADSMLEVELFGNEKGAYTDAKTAKPGLIEAADGGTLFLDEIGEMPLSTQAKLLRVLEDHQVRRLGSVRSIKVDIRIISATSRDLETAVQTGAFRSDLLFRVNGISLSVPPLRERPAELAVLAQKFVEEASRAAGRAPPELSTEAMAALKRYSWPGNVRELRNAMERAVLLCTGSQLTAEHLPVEKAQATVYAQVRAPRNERERIEEVLQSCGGNQTRAAQLLGYSRRTLLSRLTKYGLPRPRPKK
jgi:two-component system, NtrC family, response regulator AtoC